VIDHGQAHRRLAGADRGQQGVPGVAEQAPVADALRVPASSAGLNPIRWPAVWAKAGDEPGVLNLAYRATTSAGRSYVVVALDVNPARRSRRAGR
jgi:hypothetical protein